MLKLDINEELCSLYKSNSQRIRVATEHFVAKTFFCPSCGNELSEFENNRPVADFHCIKCLEQFELKSKQNNLGQKIVDGAYSSMIDRICSRDNPNFFFLSYSTITHQVTNFFVTPKYYFTTEIIEKRKPLAETAKRAGWVGCNILINSLPESGKIHFIQNGKMEDKCVVLERWAKTNFLGSNTLTDKGWLLDIMKIIEKIDKKIFYLHDIYHFESYLKQTHPQNNNIQAKIRQQLQLLRDKGYLKFVGRGCYQLL